MSAADVQPGSCYAIVPPLPQFTLRSVPPDSCRDRHLLVVKIMPPAPTCVTGLTIPGTSTCFQSETYDLTIRVDGESMQPALPNGTLAVGHRLAPGEDPQRGAVIVFAPSDEPDRSFVKRLIALPGQFIEIDGAKQRADGSVASAVLLKSCETCQPQVLNEPYLPDQSKDPWNEMTYCCDVDGRATSSAQWEQVPAGQYFVLGDDRNHSRDSRTIGFQPRQSLQGLVEGILEADGSVRALT